MTGARGAFAGLGQAGVGNARSKGCAKRVPAASQEAWPEAESLAMKDSLGREPRWNADRCAPGAPGAAAPVRRGRIPIASVGVLLPIFLSFFSFVIRAEAALATASTGIGLLQPGMEHRIGVRRTPFCERLCR